jgi:FAD binding domain-containing protein
VCRTSGSSPPWGPLPWKRNSWPPWNASAAPAASRRFPTCRNCSFSPCRGGGENGAFGADAVNLGWKLAYALNGVGNTEVLLDSYEAQRRPIARAMIAAAAQKQHLSFGASKLTSMVRNMAVSIFGNLPAVHRKLQVELSETEFVYRDGPLVALAGGKRTEVGTPAREASIVDAVSGKNTSLWPYLSAPRHSLLIFEEEGKPIALNGAVEDAGDRLQVLRPGWPLRCQWRSARTLSDA